MKEILAELRNRVVACQAILKLISKKLKTPEGGLVEIGQNLNYMAELLKRADQK